MRRRAAGRDIGTDTLLLAGIADSVALLLWRYTKAGTPRPRSLTEILTGQAEPEPTVMVFRDGRAFDEALARFIE